MLPLLPKSLLLLSIFFFHDTASQFVSLVPGRCRGRSLRKEHRQKVMYDVSRGDPGDIG